MAGRVSATDMAAVAIATSIVLPILYFLQGVILALPPIISRLNGAGRPEEVAPTTQQTFWLGIFLSIPIALLTFVIDDIMALVSMEARLKSITVEYMQYLFISTPAFVLYQVLRQYCEGLGLTKPSMVIMVIGLLVNIPANYVFIYGKLGLMPYGGAGCGIATGLVFCAMLLATWLYSRVAPKLKKYEFYQQFHLPKWIEIKKVLALGLPIALALLFEVTLFAVVAILLSPFGSNVVASHQIALNFSALIFMVPLSIGLATAIRVGHLLGAGQPHNAKHAAYSAIALGLILAFFNATLSFLLRYQIASLYTHEQVVIEMAADLMLLAALFQFSDAVQVICGCALRGYKDTKAMFYITFISYWGVGLSTGLILALTDWIVPRMAAPGFWIGFITGLTCAAILLSIRLKIIQQRTLEPEYTV